MSTATPPLPQTLTVVLDCLDPATLAEFYRAATGWDTLYADDDFVQLGANGTAHLALQRVADYQPVPWPSPAKQSHVDFTVPDQTAAVDALLTLGAKRPEFQPGDGWTVLTDPEGHVFCVAGS